jgi:hypothetical protein
MWRESVHRRGWSQSIARPDGSYVSAGQKHWTAPRGLARFLRHFPDVPHRASVTCQRSKKEASTADANRLAHSSQGSLNLTPIDPQDETI